MAIDSFDIAGIGDSLDRAFDTVLTQEDDAAIGLPNPISTGASEDFDQSSEKDGDKGKKTDHERRDESIQRADEKAKERAKERAAAKSEQKKDETKDPTFSPNHMEDQKILSDIMDKASNGSVEKFSERDFVSKESREHRQALRSRYPGASLGDVMAQFEQWETAFRRDPVTTREEIMASYLKYSPQNFTKAKDREYEAGAGGSVERAEESQRDMQELKPYLEKYGKHFPFLMRQLVEFDKGMMDDPVGTSARLAANYGALDAPPSQQVQTLAQPAPQQHQVPEHMASVHQGLELAIQTNVLPGLERPEIQEAVAVALESGAVPRTGDRFVDLKAAHAFVVKRLNEKPQRAARGSKSISGAPGRGSAPGKPRSDGLDASLDKAFGRM